MNNSDLMEEIEKFNHDRVWVTKKCRMNSEERYLRYETTSQFLLNWYSITMLALSVVTLYKPDEKLDVLNLVLSILLLGVTLIVTGFKFKETANEYKISYINITSIEYELNSLDSQLRDNILDESVNAYELFLEIQQKYNDILSQTPNHKSVDLKKLNVEKNKVGFIKLSCYYLTILFKILLLVIAICIPVALIIVKFF